MKMALASPTGSATTAEMIVTRKVPDSRAQMPKCLLANWGVQRVSPKNSVRATDWKKGMDSITSTAAMPSVVRTLRRAHAPRAYLTASSFGLSYTCSRRSAADGAERDSRSAVGVAGVGSVLMLEESRPFECSKSPMFGGAPRSFPAHVRAQGRRGVYSSVVVSAAAPSIVCRSIDSTCVPVTSTSSAPKTVPVVRF